MKPTVSLPPIQADRRTSEIHRRPGGLRSDSSPVVRIRFLREMNHHLTSLKSSNGHTDVPSHENCDSLCREQLKEKYSELGKEHAVLQLLMDMTRNPLHSNEILVLAEILFGSATLRDAAISIQHSSGNRKTTPDPDEIPGRLSKLLDEFNKSQKAKGIHPILLATQLHHGITKIHPFKDWNGRIARLMLNVALMKTGCLPVLIARSERRTYYESLEAADQGDISSLASFIADKQLESIEAFTSSAEYLSINAKFELESRLKGISQHERCLVLTEDSTSNNLLGVLLGILRFQHEGNSFVLIRRLFQTRIRQPVFHLCKRENAQYAHSRAS